jgi:urease accessory protein
LFQHSSDGSAVLGLGALRCGVRGARLAQIVWVRRDRERDGRKGDSVDDARRPAACGAHASARSCGLTMTTVLTIVTEVRTALTPEELVGRERDVVVMTAEERRWGRRRVVTVGGRELALALPTGMGLEPGGVLHVDVDWYVVVEAAEEDVLVVRPRSWEEGLRVAFEVGNRHFTLAVDRERVLVPDDPAMEQLLRRLEVPFERTRAVFVPIGRGHRHD